MKKNENPSKSEKNIWDTIITCVDPAREAFSVKRSNNFSFSSCNFCQKDITH